ncbi:MAG: 2-oxoacid:acceptor oxidoreductase subunit alpha [Candidatus Bipolaricaulota bacterium]|nr:2-oxoacid:acceptor oxidoreductase subunit alpha [Candidatus Bipolaricaulota bacterium]MDW8152063.1 2-oxoacid:acceptor oxidoreductase subunit alpha [Candidatus Bipolaricaulota bacterium]
MELVVRLAGAAGQGVQSLGEVLVRSLFRSGLFVHGELSYHSRIRGGENAFTVRLADRPLFATRREADLLVVLTPEMWRAYGARLRPGAWVVAEEGAAPEGPRVLRLPALQLAREKLGLPLAQGVVLLGAAARLLGLNPSAVERALQEVFGAKAGPNLQAFALGWERAPGPAWELPPPRFGPGERMLLTGGQAVGAGALAAGCRFLAAYPMTPGTPVLEFLAQRGERYGVVVEQAEDEIAAINMALGAAYAGARAMVTTSGGGFALMVEGLSLAGMIETPVVIHLGQRPGPATGLPTRTSQENLLFALYAGHGEFPRYLTAPATPESAFYLTMQAFELAEAYQVPAILLTDQFLVDSYAVVPALDPGRVPLREHTLSPQELERLERYERFAPTPTGVSPRALPGASRHLVLVDSDEHDFYGRITEDLEIRKAMVEKRLRKEGYLAQETALPEVFPAELRGRVALLGWGSTYGALREAVEALNREEDRYAHVHFQDLWPVRWAEVEELLREARAVVTVEGNAWGQLGKLLRQETGIRPARHLARYDGRPFTPEDIVEAMRHAA